MAIRVQGEILEVQIVNEDTEFTAFAERSDGLRQFISLQAFATRNLTDDPILLIDEAEQRLHYDAQADMVQMLAKQRVSPKIIYTTHSAGCLPEDLGNGVRMVHPSGADQSRIVNRFWGQEQSGLMPLLFGMGASTLAFFPTRRAVMVEGPSDMLLFPTLFREILNETTLGFQFVPGLSNFQRAMVLQVPPKHAGIVYLLDGDSGGKEIASALRKSGVENDHIFTMNNEDETAVELEDYIDSRHLLAVVNDIINRHHHTATPLDEAALPDNRKMESLETAFLSSTGVELPKIDLAYGLFDLIDTDPTIRLVDSRSANDLEKLCKRVVTRLSQ